MAGVYAEHGWLLRTSITWEATGKHPFRYRALVGDLRLALYCGYAPLVPPYGLYVNEEESFLVGALPGSWTLPSARPT